MSDQARQDPSLPDFAAFKARHEGINGRTRLEAEAHKRQIEAAAPLEAVRNAARVMKGTTVTEPCDLRPFAASIIRFVQAIIQADWGNRLQTLARGGDESPSNAFQDAIAIYQLARTPDRIDQIVKRLEIISKNAATEKECGSRTWEAGKHQKAVDALLRYELPHKLVPNLDPFVSTLEQGRRSKEPGERQTEAPPDEAGAPFAYKGPDGPFDPDGFWFEGIEVRFKKAVLRYRLVSALWDKSKNQLAAPRSCEAVIDEVYGDEETEDATFRKLCSDATGVFAKASCPLVITILNSMVQLRRA